MKKTTLLLVTLLCLAGINAKAQTSLEKAEHPCAAFCRLGSVRDDRAAAGGSAVAGGGHSGPDDGNAVHHLHCDPVSPEP